MIWAEMKKAANLVCGHLYVNFWDKTTNKLWLLSGKFHNAFGWVNSLYKSLIFWTSRQNLINSTFWQVHNLWTIPNSLNMSTLHYVNKSMFYTENWVFYRRYCVNIFQLENLVRGHLNFLSCLRVLWFKIATNKIAELCEHIVLCWLTYKCHIWGVHNNPQNCPHLESSFCINRFLSFSSQYTVKTRDPYQALVSLTWT